MIEYFVHPARFADEEKKRKEAEKQLNEARAALRRACELLDISASVIPRTCASHRLNIEEFIRLHGSPAP